jgi:predicted cupin superfamily sugar epimerase
MQDAAYWVHCLALKPHPEGGFYRETYRAAEAIETSGLPARFTGRRSFSTAIYFLLRGQDRSVFHRIRSDELWHYHAGDSLSIYVLHEETGLTVHRLGADIARGDALQVVVPANTWFGARLEAPGRYTLAGCTVAPGFDFADFEMADRATLLKTFSGHADIITSLTNP